MKNIVFLSLLLLTLVTGCSSSPGASSVKSYLDDSWAGCSKLVSVDNVKKTNGVPGNGSYEVDFSYDLVFKHPISNVFSVFNYCTKDRPAQVLGGALMKLGAVKEGDTFQMTGSVDMIKSENGWIVEDQ